jgi:hypothetical protein
MRKQIVRLALALALLCSAAVADYLHYYRAVVLSSTVVQGAYALPNFPYLLTLTSSDFKPVSGGGMIQNSVTYGDGQTCPADLIISTSTSAANVIPFECDSWDQTAGTINYWINVPSLDPSTNLVYYVIYDNTDITTWQGGTTGAVWAFDGNYAGVYHLSNGSATSYHNYAAAINNLTNTAGTAGVGQIGGGVIEGTGVGAQVGNALPPSGSTAFSWSAWVNVGVVTDALRGARIITISDGVLQEYLAIFATNVVFSWTDSTNASHSITYSATLPTTGWHYLVGVASNGYQALYVDGALEANTVLALTPEIVNPPTYVGGFGLYGGQFTGTLDEVRMASVLRSPSWIATEYANQTNAPTYIILGPQTTIVSSFTVSPGVVSVNSTNALVLTGTLTNWIAGVCPFTFTLPAGASVSSCAASTSTNASVTLVTGPGVGTVTLFDGAAPGHPTGYVQVQGTQNNGTTTFASVS